ncbi:MAG: MFS transporter [Candidatus Limivicinus sp.]|nr:MFS transporter [Clostridiales bacterium]MDY3859790.1 MFS transporter [Candidatus Limivicinus sp.]
MNLDIRQGRAWLTVLGGFLIMALLHSMIQTCFSLFMIPVTEDMGISRTTYSLCTSLVAIATAVLAPTLGTLLGKSAYTRRIFILCIVCMGLSYASYSFAQNIYHMYISAVFVGVFSCGAASMPVSIILVNRFREHRGLALSIALAGSGIGGSIITPVLTKLISQHGWRAGFLVFGLAMIVIEVPVALLLMQPCPERTDDLPCGLNGSPDAHAPGAQDPEANIPLGELKRQPFFYIYLIGMLSVSFVGYGSLAHLSIHLTDVYNPAFSNALISFFLLLLTPAKICLGWMYDRMGAKIANIVVMSFHAVSFLLLQTNGNESMMWIMAGCFSVGITNGTVAPSVVTAALFGTKDYGTIFGYVYSFCMLGMVLGSPVIALIYDLTGTYRLAWATCFTMCLLTIVCLSYADRLCRKAVERELQA